MVEFAYEDLLPIGPDETPWRLLTTEGVRLVNGEGALAGQQFLQVDDAALRLLSGDRHARHRALPASGSPRAVARHP
jgi:hypothetical protein